MHAHSHIHLCSMKIWYQCIDILETRSYCCCFFFGFYVVVFSKVFIMCMHGNASVSTVYTFESEKCVQMCHQCYDAEAHYYLINCLHGVSLPSECREGFYRCRLHKFYRCLLEHVLAFCGPWNNDSFTVLFWFVLSLQLYRFCASSYGCHYFESYSRYKPFGIRGMNEQNDSHSCLSHREKNSPNKLRSLLEMCTTKLHFDTNAFVHREKNNWLKNVYDRKIMIVLAFS